MISYHLSVSLTKGVFFSRIEWHSLWFFFFSTELRAVFYTNDTRTQMYDSLFIVNGRSMVHVSQLDDLKIWRTFFFPTLSCSIFRVCMHVGWSRNEDAFHNCIHFFHKLYTFISISCLKILPYLCPIWYENMQARKKLFLINVISSSERVKWREWERERAKKNTHKTCK